MQGNVDCRAGRAAVAIALAILLNACAGMGPVAEVLLAPVPGTTTTGRAVFEQKENGIHVVAYVAGLGFGPHGLHVHEKADCGTAEDASALGLTMSESDAYGNAKFNAVLPGLTLQGDKSIAGKAVAVRTAPGARMACGVIVKR